MAISCTPGDLIESSKCILSCTDEGQRDAMKVWLLTQIAGVNASPGYLLEQSRCLECLNEGQLKSIQAWLMCQILNTACDTINLSALSGSVFPQSITASGGTGPYVFLVVAGSLPDGLLLSSDGTLSGTPTLVGTFNFTILAVDQNGCRGQRDYTVSIPPNSVWADALAYWKMNELGNGVPRLDSTTNAINLGDISGNAGYGVGFIAAAVYINSDGSALDFNGVLPAIGASGYTIHGWMQADDATKVTEFFGYEGGITLKYNNGTWEFSHIGTGSTLSVSIVSPISTVGWTRFCARGINGGTLKLTIDTTDNSGPAPPDMDYSFPNQLEVTASIFSTGTGGFRFDEVSIWPRVLSDLEVAYLWNGGAGHTYNDP